MTHISYLQSLPNPSSTSSETDYCLQTPEERTEERGGGCKVEIDASMIQYTEETRMCACVDRSMDVYLLIAEALQVLF